jgi:hypothetical protein
MSHRHVKNSAVNEVMDSSTQKFYTEEASSAEIE